MIALKLVLSQLEVDDDQKCIFPGFSIEKGGVTYPRTFLYFIFLKMMLKLKKLMLKRK